MTFGRTFGGVSTLAHELGHAYHAWLLRELPYFATSYPMTLAETASTFCENLVMDGALTTATGDHRLSLLGKIGDEAVTMLMNLRARFLFETAFFENRRKQPLTADELSELMVVAQREAYKNGLAENGYHRLFWASKLHFYITNMPFYNFPYVFGYLFSSGLSARASVEGNSFAATYAKMLGDSGMMTCEELALRYLGEDITQTAFWENAVDKVLQVVPLFVEAAKASGR
jgi:oligoendopeptidase F